MPFDFESFFTPRFPVIKRDRSMEPLGPEFPPDFDYDKYGMDDRPEWKKKIQGLFESGVDSAAGFLGLPAYPETKAYGMGELTEAGIPFLALGRKLKLPEINNKPVVWRGDPGVDANYVANYREINPQYFNRQDTLGYMGHAAENKDYAINDYMYKRGSPYRAGQTEHHGYQPKARPNLTAVTAPSSINAVDLTTLPSAEDTEKLIKGLELWNPRKSPFGEADRLNTRQKAQDLAADIPRLYRKQIELDKKLREGVPLNMREQRDLTEIGDAMDNIRIPLNDPEITNKLGFDAIRYTDIRQPSWAFPDVSKMETPWGVKLGQKSMGDYRYRVQGPLDYSYADPKREDIGFFKTDKEAMKAAVERGRGSRVYLGSASGEAPLAVIGAEKNVDLKRNNIPGLSEYIAHDKEIQQQIGNVQPKKYPTQMPKSIQDGYSNTMYGKKYDNLNDWQKWDVDAKIKNEQKSLGVPDDDIDFEAGNFVDDADDPVYKKDKLLMQIENEVASDDYGKDFNQLSEGDKKKVFDKAEKMYQDGDYDTPPNKPKVSESLKDKIKFKIAKEDYGDDYYNLSKDSKKNVDDIYETLVGDNVTDNIDWLKKQYPSIANELDEVYGTGSKPLSGTGWKHYKGKY